MEYALVTGASSGMGLQYALQLAGTGYGIIIVSNRPDDNVRAAELVRSSFPLSDVRVIDADLTLADSAEMIYSTVSRWGLDVEVLISNAGILLFSFLVNTSPENIERIIALHCLTPTKLVRLFGEDMKRKGHGYILLMSSATAWMQYPTISHYGATKAYLKNFSRSLWYEMKRYGVAVTAVFPGAVDTPLYKLSDSKRKLLRRLGVMMGPERVVSIALRKMFSGRYRCIPGLFTRAVVCICVMVPACVVRLLLKVPVLRKILDSIS